MTKEEIINLANRCSRKIWEICMEEPGFSINDCPEGANGLSDIVLNVILKEFSAIKECSSFPSNLDGAAMLSANGAVISRQSSIDGRVVYNLNEKCFNHEDLVKQFKKGAEWMARQGETICGIITKVGDRLDVETTEYLSEGSEFERRENVIIQVRKIQ